jgi:hypothetical protein
MLGTHVAYAAFKFRLILHQRRSGDHVQQARHEAVLLPRGDLRLADPVDLSLQRILGGDGAIVDRVI